MSDTPLYVRNDMALQDGIIRVRDEMRKSNVELSDRVALLEQQIADLRQQIVLAVAFGRGSGPTEIV